MAITKEKALDILDRMDLQIFREDVAELKAYITDVVPKSEVDKARQKGYESGKRESVREIYKELHNEIIDARNSNFEAIKERETKHNVNRYEDTFCYYCDGKIHALEGIDYFMDELTKKYIGE